MDELWDDYLGYLIWRCHLEKKTYYSRLFEILHNIEFIYIIDRDDNRVSDGMDLRNNYYFPPCYGPELKYDFMNHWCSVLEVLIGLSIRVDDEIIGDPFEEHPEEFFIEMIKNLKLDKFKDNINYKEEDIIKIVDRWLNREFNMDGRGSPFPLKYDFRDQRKLEIWDQVNSYINENYGLGW